MEINMTKKVPIQAKSINICIKIRDEFACNIRDQDGVILKDYEGYVPNFMPGEHYGDYLMLDIDIDTGTITNWKKLDASDIESFIEGEED